MPERFSRLPIGVRVVAPLVVLAVALVFGSGVLRARAETPAQHAAAIERVVRCPSCTDVSVAESTQTTALAVRHEIVRQVNEGRTSGQIEQTLVSQYGPTILLVPPDTGGFAIIWLIPIVLGLGVLIGVGWLFWRRARQFSALRETATP
jgi:cytochrome c-type biogenesis protein CcmH/NrfF